MPLGIRIIANAAIIIFGYLSYKGIFWTIDDIKSLGYSPGSEFYTITFILAFVLSIFMRMGIKFANYALGSLFIWMGYSAMHISDEAPGLASIIGYVSIFIGCFLLLVRIIFKSDKYNSFI